MKTPGSVIETVPARPLLWAGPMTNRISALFFIASAGFVLGARCPLNDITELLAAACDGTLEVTTTAEDVDPAHPDAFHVCGAQCTLRDAIATANSCDDPQTILLPVGYVRDAVLKPAVRKPPEEVVFWNTWGSRRD